MDKAGRKMIQCVGLAGMCLAYVLMTVALVGNMPRLAVVAMVCIIIFFAFGPGCIAWFIVAELIPLHARSFAVGVGMGLNWITNWLVAFMFPHLLIWLGDWTFTVFIMTTGSF